MTIKENLAYLKYFGFDLTFWKTLNKIFSRKKANKQRSASEKKDADRSIFYSFTTMYSSVSTMQSLSG